jgi:cell division protease FtsH
MFPAWQPIETPPAPIARGNHLEGGNAKVSRHAGDVRAARTARVRARSAELLERARPAAAATGRDLAEETAAAINEEVRSAMDRALAIRREKRDVLERSARKLLEKETLDENDLAALIGPPAGAPDQIAAE